MVLVDCSKNCCLVTRCDTLVTLSLLCKLLTGKVCDACDKCDTVLVAPGYSKKGGEHGRLYKRREFSFFTHS